MGPLVKRRFWGAGRLGRDRTREGGCSPPVTPGRGLCFRDRATREGQFPLQPPRSAVGIALRARRPRPRVHRVPHRLWPPVTVTLLPGGGLVSARRGA
jgi:hypothetical protein